MSTWAIGDVQGCFDSLQALLATLGWRPGGDDLWFTGDLVNRGPKSLSVLRFAAKHDLRTVLGNHDLHLLARADGDRPAGRGDTLDKVLGAKDRGPLLDWLRQQPLLHEGERDVLVHAGVPPRWDLSKARRRAREVEEVIRRGDTATLLGPAPTARPRDARTTAGLTRMRFVDASGRPNYSSKAAPHEGPRDERPWFDAGLPDRRVVCGHWAALGLRVREGLLALDTGCVWGGALTAVCLENGDIVQQRSLEATGAAVDPVG